MKQTAFLRCFLTQERVLVDKTLNRENDSTGIIDSCLGCGQTHTAHPTAKINKVKNLAQILLISVFSLSSHLLSKMHLKQSFCYTFLLTHNCLMRFFSGTINPLL